MNQRIVASGTFVSPLARVATGQRVYSIDTLRGVTILVMIFVNELAGVTGLPAWMKHAAADADTMTFVDVVFPAFLFVVGMSIPFALGNRFNKGESLARIGSHIVFRTAGLLTLGVFMVNTEGGYNEEAMGISIHAWAILFYLCAILVWKTYPVPSKVSKWVFQGAGVAGLVMLALVYRGDEGFSPRWWGILGLIGWAYLIAVMMYFLCQGRIFLLALTFVILILAFGIGQIAKGEFVAFLNGQKGHFTHSAIVLAGIILSLIFFNERNSNAVWVKIRSAMLFAGFAGGLAVVMHNWFPVSKIYATPSWALYSITSCIVVFILLFLVVDARNYRNAFSFIQPAAANPLLAYIIPPILYHAMRLAGLHWPEWFYHSYAGIVWSLVFAFGVMGIVVLLNKARIKLQL